LLESRFGMGLLILFHGLNNLAGQQIRLRQILKVGIEMGLDLAFGLTHKPEARSITKAPR
jgi:hypothetical protein